MATGGAATRASGGGGGCGGVVVRFAIGCTRVGRRSLEALDAHKPKRGRKRTADSIEARLRHIEVRLPKADAMSRVHLAQERLNLEAELAAKGYGVDLAPLEEEFVKAAAGYGERKGLSYTAWRAAGIDAKVLRARRVSLEPEAE